MTTLLNRLFGLDAMRFGVQGVEFGFARPFPGWAWFLAVLLAFALAWWSYARLEGRRRSRVTLAALRGVLLLVLLVIVSGPQLIRPNERVENDWVLVLADRSASMGIEDAPGPLTPPGSAGGARETRDEQLRRAITGAWPKLSQMARDRTVLWLGFDAGAYDLKPDAGATGLDLGGPRGRRTSLGAALDQALARAAARPVSGVIILSDGRSIDEPSRAAMRRLEAEHIPVLTVPLGSPEPIEDLAIVAVEAPALAFVNDLVPVTIEIDRLGAPAGRPARGAVRLIEKATGRLLDERPLPPEPGEWADGRTRLVLTTRPDQAGTPAWIVRVVPDAPDLIDENNEAEVKAELIDRPLRIAYFDGYPRWEYRYLKNLLVREKTIRSISMLLASNRQYIQEGDLTLRSIPRSPEEWAAFDVVVLGDLSSGLFAREQLEQLKEYVAVRGGGLLWVGGPAATPATWRDTPLADLLPFALGARDRADAPVTDFAEPVTISRAPAAERLGVLELSESPQEPWPARLSDPATGWSQLRYAQRIDPRAVKPTAEVLAWAAPASLGGAPPDGHPSEYATPVVLTMRYGAGRVMYVGTDEIWRWRYARGEALPERFWLPLLRLQGRESIARAARSASLDARPRRAEAGTPVRVSIELLDQALVDAVPRGAGASLKVRATRRDSAVPGEAGPRGAGDAPAELTLMPEGDPGPRDTARSFATLWVPDTAGVYRLEAVDPMLAGLGLSVEIEVALADDELRRPETDHPLLARLAEETGGRVLQPESLGEAPTLLPNREVRIAGTPDVTALWDKPIVLVLLLLVLTLEWVGRRLIKLA